MVVFAQKTGKIKNKKNNGIIFFNLTSYFVSFVSADNTCKNAFK